PRSALKPLQALAGVMSGTDQQFQFTDAELAVICGSHRGEPRHRAAVRSILEKIEATEEQLHCGAPAVVDVATRDELIRAGEAPTADDNNFAGKDAGRLRLRKFSAPRWQGIGTAIIQYSRKSSVSAARCVASMVQAGSNAPLMAVLPTYLLTLRQLAQGFARLCARQHIEQAYGDACRRVLSAMI